MPAFVLSYRAPHGYVPSDASRAAWSGWFEGMGEQLIELGKPAVSRSAIGNTSSQSTELAGYSIIRADDLEAAVAVAKGCPILERNGGVEVGELGEVAPQP